MFNLNVLSKKDIQSLLKMNDVIDVVESAYSQKASNRASIFDWVFNEFDPGVADMDIKSGWLKDEGIYGMKLVSWFSKNPEKNLPSIIGVVMVFDDKTGKPIGLVDGDYITGMRTGAAGAIGAKYMARKDSKTLLMVGTGHISKFEIAATLIALPNIEEVIIINPINAQVATDMAEKLKDVLRDEFDITREFEVKSIDNIEDAVRLSDIIITATPSRKPLIMKEWLKPGTHLSCIGSDMPGKEEIDPNIFKEARVVVDDLEQCKHIGEIEIPFNLGIIDNQSISGEIGDIINKKINGRMNDDEITVFDATGTALLDLVTARLAFSIAESKKVGTTVEL
ncbi:ornithine cyclodeaminase family protein [Clostridiaceae bacterium HSG29]|nr:ornithine cyclodeaminase family protein [Clostridiaceae bacterium HSG29]